MNSISTAQKIDSFALLEDGWDYGSGGPMAEKNLDAARGWNTFLSAFPFSYTDAFPSGDGRVTIAAGAGDYYIEIIVESDLTISVAYDFKKKQKFYRLHMSNEGALQSILEMSGELCSASTSSIKRNSTRKKTNLPAQPLQIIVDHYQSSKPIVLSEPALQYVDIFDTTTVTCLDMSSVTPQYFGNLTPTTSQAAVS